MSTHVDTVIINEEQIFDTLKNGTKEDAVRIREILSKALELKGLNETEVASLAMVSDPDLLKEVFSTARRVKEEIYGKRLVLFAPLYVSNLCKNECAYCAFRSSNTLLRRKALNQDEVRREVEAIVDEGHKRILLVAGESYPSEEGFDYIINCVKTIYSVKKGRGEIRRVNVNVAPLTLEEFKRLKDAKIGTYQLFQETYHRETYNKMHIRGIKKDYDWRITAMDRAMEAGINDVGVGVLFGLFDWRFEVMALMQHIKHLEEKFGVGCHTISVPRIEPAVGSEISLHPPYAVSDIDFCKVVAILRLAVPYTGMIMTTRETPDMRRETFALGVSQISAGSRTNPGGYTGAEEEDMSQFSLGDHRGPDEVIQDITQLGYIPSFCTACYRLGRTGADFMDLAKPGLIKNFCEINALSTFAEYLEDYASPKTKEIGWARIGEILNGMSQARKKRAEPLLNRIKAGERDVYV